MAGPRVTSRVCVPTGVVQVWRFDSADLEPEREQHERLHAAGAAALHPRGRAGCAQQQGRDLAGLERKCSWQRSSAPRKTLRTAPHGQLLGDSSGGLCGSA